MIAARIISLLIGYALGNITMGVIIARINHVDIRHEGSGNVGGTNVARSIGLASGIITSLFDCLKAVLAALIVWLIYRDNPEMDVKLLMVYAAFGSIVGHVLPVIMKFKGGKGVATILGFMIVAAPLSIPINVTLFFIIGIVTRYVSLGSVIAVSLLPVTIGAFLAAGVINYPGQSGIEVLVLFIAAALLSDFMHRENIKRLLRGTENKFSVKKKDK